jgi:ribonuclease HI
VALEVLAGCVPLHIEAASAHSTWVASKSRGFEGKAVFAEGPHPAEPDRKWHELKEERITGTCFWTDASCEEERTAIGVIRTEQGEIVEKGLRLQDGYPTHMAELYALGIAIKSVSGQRGTTVNFATDSTVALDMLTKRRGGTAHRIHKELMQIEREGSAVKLWWSSDQNSGIAEADKMANRAREEPGESPEEQAPTTGRMLKKEATRAAKERWQTEWDQGEKGRMTHSIIREVDRKLRWWNHKAVCLLTGHGPDGDNG